ncbi:MAG: PEGA domain-containing protein [Candidatus Omnitrophota bacterium]
MPRSDRILRFIAFHAALLIFFIMLPIILSYSLGYKIDYRNLKTYKTGIIYLNSRPSGASVYVNGKIYKDLTPAQIEELKPGIYNIEVRREGFYPWEGKLTVRPNMVTRADSIVLFPIGGNVKMISDLDVAAFTVSDNNYMYYFAGNGLYRSSIDGGNLKKLTSYSDWPRKIRDKKFSPDGDKILYYDENDIFVVFLNPGRYDVVKRYEAKVEKVLKSPDKIIDVFWYFGSGYLIAVTDKDLKVVELRGGEARNVASLYRFTTRPGGLYYDEKGGSLYFTDTGEEPGLKSRKFLYRLDLRQTFFNSVKDFLLKNQKEPENGKK